MSQLSKEQLQVINDNYKELDKDGSNGLSKGEVKQFLMDKVGNVDDSTLDIIVSNFFVQCDTDNSGLVSLEEFKNYFITKLNAMH